MSNFQNVITRAIDALKDPTDDEARAQIYERARKALNNHLENFEHDLSSQEIEEQRSALEATIDGIELTFYVPGTQKTEQKKQIFHKIEPLPPEAPETKLASSQESSPVAKPSADAMPQEKKLARGTIKSPFFRPLDDVEPAKPAGVPDETPAPSLPTQTLISEPEIPEPGSVTLQKDTQEPELLPAWGELKNAPPAPQVKPIDTSEDLYTSNAYENSEASMFGKKQETAKFLKLSVALLLVVGLIIGVFLAYGAVTAYLDKSFDKAVLEAEISNPAPAISQGSDQQTSQSFESSEVTNEADTTKAPEEKPQEQALEHSVEPAEALPKLEDLPEREEPAQESIHGLGELGEEETSSSAQRYEVIDAGVVAERAILYEQKNENEGPRALAGTVFWSLIKEKRGRTIIGPSIRAELSSLDRGLKILMTFRKIKDENLPASHIIEIEFKLGDLFGETAISAVPYISMRAEDSERGESIAGQTIKITEDLFWLALSDTSEAQQRNSQLLASQNWFDLPILYSDGTRAILSFTKGLTGEDVFKKALEAWAQEPQ